MIALHCPPSFSSLIHAERSQPAFNRAISHPLPPLIPVPLCSSNPPHFYLLISLNRIQLVFLSLYVPVFPKPALSLLSSLSFQRTLRLKHERLEGGLHKFPGIVAFSSFLSQHAAPTIFCFSQSDLFSVTPSLSFHSHSVPGGLSHLSCF